MLPLHHRDSRGFLVAALLRLLISKTYSCVKLQYLLAMLLQVVALTTVIFCSEVCSNPMSGNYSVSKTAWAYFFKYFFIGFSFGNTILHNICHNLNSQASLTSHRTYTYVLITEKNRVAQTPQ